MASRGNSVPFMCPNSCAWQIGSKQFTSLMQNASSCFLCNISGFCLTHDTQPDNQVLYSVFCFRASGTNGWFESCPSIGQERLHQQRLVFEEQLARVQVRVHATLGGRAWDKQQQKEDNMKRRHG